MLTVLLYNVVFLLTKCIILLTACTQNIEHTLLHYADIIPYL